MSVCIRLSLLTAFWLLVIGGLQGCATQGDSVALEPPSEVTLPAFDPTEPLKVLSESVKAWSSGDLEAFVSVYAEDCLFITSSGLTRGRDAVWRDTGSAIPTPRRWGPWSLK